MRGQPLFLSLFPEVRQLGVEYLDIGCRGQVEARWRPFAGLLRYVGFDPDRSEVARLESQPSPYLSRRLFPLAIGGRTETAPLHQTRSPFCWSLLVPRRSWMQRLGCGDSFEKIGETRVDVTTLHDVVRQHGLRADVLKIDSQGLEVPILRNSGRLLDELFCLECETGFVENYIGETVTAQLDEYMRARGFLMFDIKVFRAGRCNELATRSINQPLYCETIWLRDYLSEETWGIPSIPLDRERALKALAICWALGFSDYGVELGDYFAKRGLLSPEVARALHDEVVWEDKPTGDPAGRTLVNAFRLLPQFVRGPLSSGFRRLADCSQLSVARTNLLRDVLRRGGRAGTH